MSIFLARKEIIGAAIINPIINPKLGLKNVEGPPENPAKIGRPIIPSRKYTKQVKNASKGVSNKPAIKTKNVCKLIGTGLIGKDKNAPTAIRAANRAILVIDLVSSFVFVLVLIIIPPKYINILSNELNKKEL